MTPIRRSWFHLASGAGFGRVFGFASNLLLSRWLGPTELGLFNLVTTTVQTSDTLVRCGGDYALNFELGGEPEATQTEHGASLARGLVQLCSLTTALLCVGVAIWVWSGYGVFSSSSVASHRYILSGLLLLMIACEGISASAWELLLVSHRTASLALRQGLFFPLRLLCAAAGAQFWGISGALTGWSLVAVVQCTWLKTVLRNLWNPLQIWPFSGRSMRRLLKRGFSFYASNVLASLIFFPLLLNVASGSGLSEIGYLRVGQILQQLFAFLPATLVPVLFLKLRCESTFSDQVTIMERPLRVIWLLLLEVLLFYLTFDQVLINWLFGNDYDAALLPTRILLITALFECLSQIVVQPLLAAGKTRLYGIWQNGAALFSAVLGWFWIPEAGLAAYLIVRLIYVFVPLIGFGMPVLQQFQEPRKILLLSLASVGLLILLSVQIISGNVFIWTPSFFAAALVVIAVSRREDIMSLKQALRGN